MYDQYTIYLTKNNLIFIPEHNESGTKQNPTQTRRLEKLGERSTAKIISQASQHQPSQSQKNSEDDLKIFVRDINELNKNMNWKILTFLIIFSSSVAPKLISSFQHLISSHLNNSFQWHFPLFHLVSSVSFQISENNNPPCSKKIWTLHKLHFKWITWTCKSMSNVHLTSMTCRHMMPLVQWKLKTNWKNNEKLWYVTPPSKGLFFFADQSSYWRKEPWLKRQC